MAKTVTRLAGRALRDWCSAHERDVRTVKGKLDFLADQLLNTHEGVGRELHKAETYEHAKEALEPYVRLLAMRDKGGSPQGCSTAGAEKTLGAPASSETVQGIEARQA